MKILGFNLFLPPHRNSFGIFWVRFNWSLVIQVEFNTCVKRLKMKVFATVILANKDNFLLFHFCSFILALHRGISKFSILKSPRPRKAPKYLTRTESTWIPAMIWCLFCKGEKAIIFLRFRVSPVNSPTHIMAFNILCN